MNNATKQLRLGIEGGIWTVSRDGDADCRAIFDRHYSRRRYADGRSPALFVGPGGKLVLVTPNLGAMFVWRKFIDDADDGSGQRQEGINCAVFRREGGPRASDMILAAEPFAWDKWPDESRLYTYVDANKTRHKRDPGRCFRRAGWRECGRTKGGLVILEKYRTAIR